jgi:hypothetical protein
MTIKTKTVQARQQFVAEIDGRRVVVLEGARFPATHPVAQEHKHNFDPASPPRAAA